MRTRDDNVATQEKAAERLDTGDVDAGVGTIAFAYTLTGTHQGEFEGITATGLPKTSYYWRKVAALLTPHHTVVAPVGVPRARRTAIRVRR